MEVCRKVARLVCRNEWGCQILPSSHVALGSNFSFSKPEGERERIKRRERDRGRGMERTI